MGNEFPHFTICSLGNKAYFEIFCKGLMKVINNVNTIHSSHNGVAHLQHMPSLLVSQTTEVMSVLCLSGDGNYVTMFFIGQGFKNMCPWVMILCTRLKY